MPEEEVKEEKKSSKMMIIIIAAVVAIGGGAFFMLSGSKAPEGAESVKVVQKIIHHKIPENYTISFRDDEGNHYLRVSVAFSTKSETVKELIIEHDISIRDRIISYLLSMKAEEIYESVTAKKSVQTKVFKLMNDVIDTADLKKEDVLEEVLITEFIVQ